MHNVCACESVCEWVSECVCACVRECACVRTFLCSIHKSEETAKDSAALGHKAVSGSLATVPKTKETGADMPMKGTSSHFFRKSRWEGETEKVARNKSAPLVLSPCKNFHAARARYLEFALIWKRFENSSAFSPSTLCATGPLRQGSHGIVWVNCISKTPK